MSDRIMSIAHVYMVMYSNEITWAITGLVCFALGAWLFFADGKDKGFESGFNLGFDAGIREGIWQAGETRPKRDAKGRFVKCN